MILVLATTTKDVEILLDTARQIELAAQDKSFAEQIEDAEIVLHLRRLARLSLQALDLHA